MGTGVNVQTLITDMHFMSVPWTPAALEQCIGRGARQGNWIAEAIMGNKVRVHYYATEGTLDLYKFQLLDAKGKMFTQFKTGTTSGSRDFDEGAADEDGNIDPAELVAILSGNPIIFEKAKQEKYVKKLKALHNGFLSDYQRKKAKFDELTSRKEKFERLIRINNGDVADLQREGFVPDEKGVYPSKVTVNEGSYFGRGITFDKPKEAGEYILKKLKEGKKLYLQGFGKRAEIVSVNEEKNGGLFGQHYELQTVEGYNTIRYSVRLSEDATAAGTAFRSLLQRILNNKTVYGNEYENIVNQLNGMNIGDGVFPRQAELDEAVATLKQMTAEYNALGKKESNGDKTKFRVIDEELKSFEQGAQTSAEAKRGHVEGMSRKFNTPVRIVENPEELTHSNAEMQRRMRASKGFYDPRTGEVVIVLPNNESVEDVAETMLHETVAHKGLRELVGEENYDAFCDEVYDHLKEDLKEEVDQDATRRFVNNPGKGYESARREAVDEMFGRLGEKDFEDFTQAERGIWAKLKQKVLDAINKFLGSLKLPKWVKLGDNELRYMLWKSHERLRAKGDYVERAKDAAKREELGVGQDVAMRKGTRKAANNEARLNDLDPAADREPNSEAALKHLEPSTEHDTKVQRKIDTAKDRLSKLANDYRNVTEPRGFLSDLCDSMNLIKGETGSAYRAFELANGNTIVVRVSNHNSKAHNAGQEPVVSVVIKTKRSKNTFEPAFGKVIDEYVYFKDDISNAPAGTLSKIAESMADLLDTGKYVDRTGLAKENHSGDIRFRDGETDDIWKDRSVGLEERITNAAIRLSNNQSGDLTLRNDAMRAIGGNLTSLRRAMALQRTFDQTTVKRVADLARILMQNGYLSGMTSGEMQRLLSAVKNSVGHQEVKESVQKVMDIMVENQLRNAKGIFEKQLSVRASKVDARGIEVQGELDPRGQMVVQALRRLKGMNLKVNENVDEFEKLIAEAEERLSDESAVKRENAEIELEALYIARQYAADIEGSKDAERELKELLKDADIDNKEGRMDDDAFREYAQEIKESIQSNHIDRIEAYHNLIERLGGTLGESIMRAKEFRESEKERINQIHHYANSDLNGIPYRTEKMKPTFGSALSNSWLARFFLAPAATMEQVCRVIGYKSVDGNGYVKELVIDRWQECRDREWISLQEAESAMDAKAKEIAGVKSWSDLYSISKKEAGTMSWKDGTDVIEHDVTQGNLMYLYMENKMNDGRRLLRHMGITEEDVENAVEALDPRLREAADWLQEDFFPARREIYNETYKRMFGAPMPHIDNYVPQRINKSTIEDKTDIAESASYDGNGLPKTISGSVIKRTYHNHPVDILGTDAVSLALEHVREMETWNAFAEYRRDLTTLLRYGRFRNRLRQMKTIYGSGEHFDKLFFDLAMLVGGAAKPKVGKFDRIAVNLTKLATAACIALRVNTSLKQFLSYPAFGGEASGARLALNMVRPKHCLKFCLEHLPAMQRRWKERLAGNDVLRDWSGDWDWTKSEFVKEVQRIGLTPNAFVDLVTCCCGAEAAYHTEFTELKKAGYPDEIADKKAVIKAEQIFNLSQQSSELPYLSLLQNNRSYITTSISNYRNSPFSYLRQSIQSKRELANMAQHKEEQIEFETKKAQRSGLNEEQAKAYANLKYNRNWSRNLIKSFDFDFVLPALWVLGTTGVWYLIYGNDKKKKKELIANSVKRGMYGPLEGLVGGGTMPDILYNLVEGNGFTFDEETTPGMGQLSELLNAIGRGDKWGATNHAINFATAMGLGVNPQTFEDIVVAGMDHFGKSEQTMRDWEIFAMRVISVPQSQIDMVYFDEIDMSATQAARLTPQELADRYAEYKLMHNEFATVWFMNDEQKSERMERYRKKATKEIKSRMAQGEEADIVASYDNYKERYQALDQLQRKAKDAAKEGDIDAAMRLQEEFRNSSDIAVYSAFKAYNSQYNQLYGQMLNAKTPEEFQLMTEVVPEYRRLMVNIIRDYEQGLIPTESMIELSTLMTDYTTKFQQIRQTNR